MKRFLIVLWLLILSVAAQAATISYPYQGTKWSIVKFHFDANDVNSITDGVDLTTNYSIYGTLNRITIDSNGTEIDWSVKLKDDLGITLFSKTDCNSLEEPYGYAILQTDNSDSNNHYGDVAVYGPLTCTISDVNHIEEIQTLTLDDYPTDGHFHLIYGGETTAAISYSATTPEIQSAFDALDSVGAGDITITGSGTFDSRLTTTFTYLVAAGNAPMIGIASSLTPTTTTVFTETLRGGSDLDLIDVMVYYFKGE